MFKEFTNSSVVYSFITKDEQGNAKEVVMNLIWNPVLTEKQVKGLVERFKPLTDKQPFEVKKILGDAKYLMSWKQMVNDAMESLKEELGLPTLVDEDDDNPL